MAAPVYTVRRVREPDWAALPRAELFHTGWLPPCPVRAWAQLCHDGEALFVRMEAEESPVRATLTGPLEPVSEDSCLEFFFAPGGAGDPRYFNIELNPLGTLLLGFGGPRPNRVRQVPRDAALLDIRPFSTPKGWGVAFRLPLAFLRLYFPGLALSGEWAGNFYKCGEKAPEPHYLAWAPLSSPVPDFHRPQEFGRLRFE